MMGWISPRLVAWGNPFRELCEICPQNFAFWGAVQNEPVISKNSS